MAELSYHKLIRAGHLSELTPIGQQQLLDYGVTVDIDLRSSAELEKYPDLIPSGSNLFTSRVWITMIQRVLKR